MLILSRKCMSKTRGFLSPVLSKSFYASAVSTTPIHPSFADSGILSNLPPNSYLEIKQAVPPFRAWFQTAKNPLLDRIFEILSTRDEEDISSVQSADFALTELGFRLSESFVLEVLRYSSDVLACLKFFDWAGRQPGFYHTRATFHAVFKILSRAKLMPLMLDFLGAFNGQKSVYKARFYDTLVIGYAITGKPELALELLGKMRFQGLDLDSLAYNVLLNSLVEGGFFDIVDVILNQMKMRGRANDVTNSIEMKIFCKQNQFDQAEEYLRELVCTQQMVDGHTLKVLIDSLCKKSRFEDADRLVHEFRELGCVPMNKAYDVWIKGLVRAGKPNDAMVFLQELKVQEGYIPDVFRYNMLIFRLLKEQRLNEVFDLLTEMREHHVVPDKVTMNAVMCFFCKAGMVDVALELYHLRSEFGLSPNSMVYNYLLNSLCGYGSVDEAFDILKTSVEQGNFHGKNTFWIVTDALCREGKFDKMMQLFDLALHHNFKPNDFSYNKLISSLCRSKRIEDVYLVHEQVSSRFNVETTGKTYSHMIRGLNRMRRGDIAARLLIEMQEKGHEPTRGLVRAVVRHILKMPNAEERFFQLLGMQLQAARQECSGYSYNLFIAAAGHEGRPDLAEKVLQMMKKNGVEPNIDSDILMLQGYLNNDRIADAFSLYSDVRKRRDIKRRLFHVMVVGLCKADRVDFALEIMTEIKKNGLVPSLTCYEELLILLCREQLYDKAVQLFNEMEKAGRYLSSFIGNVLLLHSLKSRYLLAAWKGLRDFSNETPSSIMLGKLIATFSGEFIFDNRAEYIEEELQQYFPPDVFTYNILMRRLFDHCDDRTEEALKLYDLMCRKGFEPNKWTYATLIRGLNKHGRKIEARRFEEKMVCHLGLSDNENRASYI